jgi:hypothetical protein
MLEIYANNKKLNLPEDIKINLTFENPLFIQESIPATYSMSFNIPATPGNLLIVGNPNRVASLGVWTEMESRIVFDAIVISTGKLLLQESEKNLKFVFIGSLIPAIVKEKMNALQLDRTDFGPGIPYNPDFTEDDWSYLYQNFVYSNAITNCNKFAACPIRVKDAEWVLQENINGFYNLILLYMNMYNMNTGTYLFTEEGEAPIHASVFPQPYIHYLLDLVLGSSLGRNIFKEIPELQKLCMITSHHKLFSDSYFLLSRGGILIDSINATQDSLYVYLSSFFSKYPFNDFLKNLLNLFCCSFIPKPDGQWDIIPNKEIIQTNDCVDWSDKLAGVPTISFQKARKYSYGYPSENQVYDGGTYLKLNNVDELLNASAGTYYIIATGEIYEKSLKDEDVPGVYVYENKNSGLGAYDNETSEYDSEKETYTIESEVKPIQMCPDEYWFKNTNVTRGRWYVPQFTGDRLANDSAPQIGFFRGMYNPATKKFETGLMYWGWRYPYMTPYNYDQAGNKIGDYSLAWEGTDGVLNKFHKEFKEYIEKDHPTLKGNFLLTPFDLKNLDYTKKIYIRGKKYHLLKIETTIQKKGFALSRCELIEA